MVCRKKPRKVEDSPMLATRGLMFTVLFLVVTLVTVGRPRELQDGNRNTAQKLIKEAEELRRAGDGESLRKAIDRLVESISFLETAGDRPGEAGALFQISAIYRLLGDNRQAEEF